MRLLVLLVSLSVAGCSGEAGQEVASVDTTPTTTTAPATSTRPPPGTADEQDQEPDVILLLPGERTDQAMIDAARHDLANRLQVPVGDIRVEGSGSVEVSSATPCIDSSQGVAPPGLVMGYEIVLSAGENLYSYIATAALLHYCGTD